MDIINLISLVVGTAIGISGILIGYKIAKKSGAFRKVVLDVSLMNQSLTYDPQLKEVIFGYPVSQNDIAYCYLPFEISNNGELSTHNVYVTLAFPLLLVPGLDDDNVKLDIKFVDHSGVKRSSFEFKGRWYVTYKISQIDPGRSVRIGELIDIVRASITPFKVDGISKDGVPYQATCHLEYRSQIHVQVSATDIAPLGGHFCVRSYQAKNREELKKKIVWEETQVLRKRLAEIGAPKEIIENLYAPGVNAKAIVIMPELKKIPKPKECSAIKGLVYIEEHEKSKVWLITSERKRGVKKFNYK